MSKAPRSPEEPTPSERASPTSGATGTAWPGESTLADFAGLSPGEKIGLAMSAGPWTVLKRLGPEEAPEPVPMLFAGAIGRLAAPDVLSLVHASGLEGELLFTFPDAAKKVFLRGGAIVFATSTLVDDRLGEMLLARGRLDRKTFADVTGEATKEGKKLGRVLVERRILSSHELYEAVIEQVESIVLSLFTYREGTFAFTARTVPIANPVRLPNPISHYILDGVRLSDELSAAMTTVSDRLAVLRPSGKGALSIADGRPGVERDVAALLDGTSPVWEVLARSSWSEANTLLALARLLKGGVIERVRAGEAMPAAGSPVDPAVITALTERLNGFLKDVHAAVAARGGDSSAVNGFFDGLPPNLRGVFGRERLGPDGTLDARTLAVNFQRLSGFPAENLKYFKEGLRLIAEFALWVASDQVPEKEAARLSEQARRLREGRE